MRETVRTDGTVTSVLDFIYDESGKPFAMIDQLSAQPKTYYYVLNLQGDVVKLVTESGAVAASYEYDAWGNILASSGSMAEKNPLRYRGYYYDSETGFYYLQSRYYDPATRRFINADSYASTGQGFVGTNMFAYCNNRSINGYDPDGRSALNTNLMFPDCGARSCGGAVSSGSGAGAGLLVAGLLILAVSSSPSEEAAVSKASAGTENKSATEETKTPEKTKTPDVTYPGDDPANPPDGTSWKGKGPQGSKQGNYYNPKTGESWHPDLDHPDPIGSHWDYRDSNNIWWRVGKNTITIK